MGDHAAYLAGGEGLSATPVRLGGPHQRLRWGVRAVPRSLLMTLAPLLDALADDPGLTRALAVARRPALTADITVRCRCEAGR